MNYRQPSVVETMIWLTAAAIAAFVAICVTLLMATVGAVMLLARMAGEAARSIFSGSFGRSTIHKQHSKEQGVRPTIIEGQVLSRSQSIFGTTSAPTAESRSEEVAICYLADAK